MTDKPVLLFGTGATIWSADAWIKRTYRETMARLKQGHPEDASIPTLSDETLQNFCGPSLRTNLTSLFGEGSPLIEEGAVIYRALHNTDEGLRAVEPYPNLFSSLARLKARGYRLGVVTEKQTQTAVQSLRHLGQDGLFDVIAGCPSDRQTVSKADVVQMAMDQMGVARTDVVLVDGRAKGIANVVQTLGLSTIGALWGGEPAQTLSEAGTLVNVETPQMMADGLIAYEAHPGRSLGVLWGAKNEGTRFKFGS